MADAPHPKPVRSSTNSKGRQNSPPPYRSHAETSMEDLSVPLPAPVGLGLCGLEHAQDSGGRRRGWSGPHLSAASSATTTATAAHSSQTRAQSSPRNHADPLVLTPRSVNECVQSPCASHPATRLTLSLARRFWQHAMNVAEHHEDDFKHQALPLARIKKVAKMDPEVQVRRSDPHLNLTLRLTRSRC